MPRSPSGASARPSPRVLIKSLERNALHTSRIRDMVRLNGNRSSTQKRLLAALLRRPSLVPNVLLRSGIRRDDFPKELRNAFVNATKKPGSGRQIAADPNVDPTIRRLFMQGVELGHGQALRLAEQIV